MRPAFTHIDVHFVPIPILRVSEDVPAPQAGYPQGSPAELLELGCGIADFAGVAEA
jgi:hypothetical protein